MGSRASTAPAGSPGRTRTVPSFASELLYRGKSHRGRGPAGRRDFETDSYESNRPGRARQQGEGLAAAIAIGQHIGAGAARSAMLRVNCALTKGPEWSRYLRPDQMVRLIHGQFWPGVNSTRSSNRLHSVPLAWR